MRRADDSSHGTDVSAQARSRVDADGLAAELRATISGEVRFDAGSQALYSTGSGNYRQIPIGVVIPRSAEDVVETLAACRRYGAPVLSRGGGTSLAGQVANVAVVMDFSKYMNSILELDPEGRRARVQPGVVLDHLRGEAEKHGLTFAPDPSTHAWCTLGGMIGNNSCGVHSLMGGLTADNLIELEILTYDGLQMRVRATSEEELRAIIASGGRRGEIYAKLKDLRDRYAELVRERYPKIPRRVSGYNLDRLLPEAGFDVAKALVGTEGTCVTVLEALVRLVPSPPARALLVLGYPDVYTAADGVVDILPHAPIGLEGLDDRLINDMRKKKLHPEDVELLPEGGGWLLCEFGGESKEEADERARVLMQELRKAKAQPSMKLFDDPGQEKLIWEIRESGLGATARVPGEPDAWEGWEDSAAPPERLGDYLRELRNLFGRYGYDGAFYGHFGQGCLHTRINFDLVTADGIRAFRSFLEEAADLVVSFGGSLSGEHGDGQARAELLGRMFGEELVQGFREFKAIWDPEEKMNPGKVVDPYPVDENLRLGSGYRPPQLTTHFQYPEDGGSLARATLRCVGVGKCRRTGEGTMCPSYMATREEKHTTRGRARMLFEMLQGDPMRGGWRDRHVLESLELCLSCKGCKAECPVNVDMATYKAEFYSHYYRGRPRPIQAYSLGLIYWSARLASHAPGLAGFLTHAPLLSRFVKLAGGVAPQRPAPRFARQSFRDWFTTRNHQNTCGSRVLLWPDTFNNYFHPEVAIAGVEVLEEAGYKVEIPPRVLCCGRPLYDYGMLPTAKRLLRQLLEVIRPQIADGVPVVCLEPSCTAVFRDELPNLFPHDQDALRLAGQVYTLAEFLEKENYHPPRLSSRAIVHGHCHHKAIMGLEADRSVLAKLGLEFEILNSECCGLAGSYGFERGEKYEVSVKVGEMVLLPAVRAAPKDTLVITDGFSCRTQIDHRSGRTALHLAQVLRMAQTGRPEPREYPESQSRDARRRRAEIAAVVGLFVVAGVLVPAVVAKRKGRAR